ncbi:serine/threonine protein kinase [Nonomuraea glycinis]|uniref:serine/threonine protein kinase n=1 Tax=Nonomuraea glycinis TaxID=2047744 RepID=UPI002E142E32|nr:serine/threonine protein kinase [Nonomuraea glycinis]
MPPTVEDPAVLGGYAIRGRLGEGERGVVYLGAGDDGGQVAIKWLRPHLAGDPVAARRFAREAALARRVAPFCTAKVLATGVHEDRPYIVSEYVDGPSLRQAVARDGPWAGSGLHRLAIGTATALAAIHQAGIVHRAFDPDNVLLGGEGPRVIDFGRAQAFDGQMFDGQAFDAQAFDAGAFDVNALDAGAFDADAAIGAEPVGDPAFMAPEQLLGRAAGPAADMFAWASTLVFAADGVGPFAAGGVGPFAAASAPEIVRRVLYDEPDLTGLAEPLRGVVATCLAKDPARRPTAERVILRLMEHPASGQRERERAAALVSGHRPNPPVEPGREAAVESVRERAVESGREAAGDPVREKAGEPVRGSGRRGWVVGAVAVGVALVTTVAVVLVSVNDLDGRPRVRSTALTGTPAGSPTPTPVRTANLVSSPLPGTDATFFEHPSDTARLTTYSVYSAKAKQWVYYTRDSLSGRFRKYADVWESVLSPDGRYLARRGKRYRNGYDSVKITDKMTGRTSTVDVVRRPLSAYVQAWSRDSRRLLLNVGTPIKDSWQSTGFAVVDVTRRTATVAALRESRLSDIRYGFAPAGGGVVALAVGARRQALRFFDGDGRRLRSIPDVGAGVADYLFSPSGKKFVTNCPGLATGTACVYDSLSGLELERFDNRCTNLANWYDDDHLICWVRPDTGGQGHQAQVVDFTGNPVRVLVDAPTGAADLSVTYTYTD